MWTRGGGSGRTHQAMVDLFARKQSYLYSAWTLRTVSWKNSSCACNIAQHERQDMMRQRDACSMASCMTYGMAVRLCTSMPFIQGYAVWRLDQVQVATLNPDQTTSPSAEPRASPPAPV